MVNVRQPADADPRRTFRILILGDGYGERIAEECLGHGYEVVSAARHDEAIRFLEQQGHVDAAVAPAFMETETVFDFLIGMRRDPKNPAPPPLMILSAEPSQLAALCTPAVEIAANLLGACKFVTMPVFDMDRVMKEIDAMLPELPSKFRVYQ